jgi:geranylgeranyl reductase
MATQKTIANVDGAAPELQPGAVAGRRTFDVAVVGGGPSGATAAHDLALKGLSVALIDRAGRIKPCGGAVPPCLMREFDVPEHLLVARISSARMISPSNASVDMPVDGGYVGMVDRDVFDEWLRERAAASGATRITGTLEDVTRDGDGRLELQVRGQPQGSHEGTIATIRAHYVIGADGAVSTVARRAMPEMPRAPFVFAYHEIVDARSAAASSYDGRRCEVYYQGRLSPDFYAWVFPHGETASVGVGSAHKGFSLRTAVGDLRRDCGLANAPTIRREGAPIPLKPLKRWDNGRDCLLAGDAAGVVAPASGEGIYYAMLCGRLAADAVHDCVLTGDGRALASARRRFMAAHGRTFWALGLLQYFWYCNDRRRERFVSMCKDKDVQRLTWQSYMNKQLVKSKPAAHARVLVKDIAHLMGLVSPR